MKQFFKILTFIIMTLSLFSCEKEKIEVGEPTNDITLDLDLVRIHLTTKNLTKAYNLNEDIHDLHVFVFGIYGQLIDHQFFNDLSTTPAVNGASGTKTYVVIANIGPDYPFSENITLSQIRQLKYNQIPGTNSSIVYTGEITKISKPGDRDVTIPIRRILSKITFVFKKDKLDPLSNMIIKKIQLRNVPKSCYFLEMNIPTAEDIDDYGDYIDINTSNLEAEDHTIAAPLYMFENLQGIHGSATVSKDKNPGAKATTATYVEITADYTSPKKTGTVVYRTWLGNDALNDFNIERESHYQYTYTFLGSSLDQGSWRVDTDNLVDITYSITASANPSEGGTITGQGNYKYGQTPTLNAIANPNYTFTGWNQTISPVTGNAHYVANFAFTNVPITSITIGWMPGFVYSGQTRQAVATITPTNATNKSVAWTSSNSSVATVDANGIVTAWTNGTATITATAQDGSGVSGSRAISVAIKQYVESVSVILANSTLTAAGQTTQATAIIMPENAEDKSVTWTSSNTSVATVNSSGIVTAVGPGTTTIQARANDGSTQSGSAELLVDYSASNVLVSSINVSLARSYLTTINESTVATATISPANATNKSVAWTSSNSSVATVDASGIVRAVAEGTATITATAQDGSGKSGSATITVSIAPSEVLINSISVSLAKSTLTTASETTTATATILPTNATNKSVAWTSSNTSVATVNASGIVTAVGSGTATITATAQDGSGKSGSATITVSITTTVNVSGIVVSLASNEIDENQSTTATATILPTNATNKSVTWTSSNSSIATVDASGIVYGHSNGLATITATAQDGSGVSGSATIKVNRPLIPVKSFTLNQTLLHLDQNATFTLVASNILPTNATDKTILYTSNNPSVATVDKETGLVTAISGGVATITAYSRSTPDIKINVTVYVYEPIEIVLSKTESNIMYDPITDDMISRDIIVYAQVLFDGGQSWESQMHKVAALSSWSINIIGHVDGVPVATKQVTLDTSNNNRYPHLSAHGPVFGHYPAAEKFHFTFTPGTSYIGKYKVTWRYADGANAPI